MEKRETSTTAEEVMSNIEVNPESHRPERMSHRMAVGGTAAETLLGLAAVVLSILALAGLAMRPLASIAVIATGAALLFEGAAYARTVGRESEGLIKGGIGADSVAGLGAVALGILSLIGLDATTLLPVSAIVLGAGLLIASGAMSAERERVHPKEAFEYAPVTSATAGVRALVGAGAVVLGILGLLGNAPIVLTLIAMLSVGGGMLLSGATFGGRLGTLLGA
jgi:hypothetical protein